MSTDLHPTANGSTTAPTVEQANAKADTARGSWFSTLTYDPFFWRGERSGMADRRRQLLTAARGRVLELGAGTGLNLPHYPQELDRLVLAEPEPHMAKRLERRLESLRRAAEVVRAPAEALPFADDTFDVVVSTMVLCTVEDPKRSLAEVRRVLRPAGSFLFIEHVRSDEAKRARWQDRLRGPWESFGDGCRCNQPTLDILRDEGFAISAIDRAQWRRMPPILQPLIYGQASPA